jgi:hypothetical protein
VIEFLGGQQVLFSGNARVQSHAVNAQGASATPLPLLYVGPGANATKVTVSPRPAALLATRPMAFTAAAVDKDGNPVPAPLAWTVSDPTLGALTGRGASVSLVPTGKAGSLAITVRTPTGVTDQATTRLATSVGPLLVISGSGQVRTVATVLPDVVVVEARTSDGIPLANVPIAFTPPRRTPQGALRQRRRSAPARVRRRFPPLRPTAPPLSASRRLPRPTGRLPLPLWAETDKSRTFGSHWRSRSSRRRRINSAIPWPGLWSRGRRQARAA